ncbi:MAG: hypothetical protein WDN24_13315 [Sphingomonas sp.]
MSNLDRESLAQHLRSLAIENFTIMLDHVRVGASRWRASRCSCGDPKCDGWMLEPFHQERASS